MTLLAYAYAYCAGFFTLYVLVMAIYRAHLAKRLHLYAYALLGWAVLVGFIVDVLSNVFIAPFVFWDPPKEWLVTTRLTRYRTDKQYQGTRAELLAVFICDNLLDPFDPTEDHC